MYVNYLFLIGIIVIACIRTIYMERFKVMEIKKQGYDILFDKVAYYQNKYNTNPQEIDTYKKMDFGKILSLGINDCYESCKGNCIEYGLTGNAYCFLN